MRTFIAMNLDASLHKPIGNLIEKFASSGASVKWVVPHNVHVTLKFLGNVEEDRLPDIYAACERAAEGLEPFEVDVRNMGCFPNLNRPRVVWVGIEKGREAIIHLQKKVEGELSIIGYPKEERTFKAHLTIGRIRDQKGTSRLRRLIENAQDISIGSMRAEEFSVMKSKTLPAGPIYSRLKSIPLT